MANENGVSVAECVAAICHLAPYVGYPTAAVALKALQQLSPDVAGSQQPDRMTSRRSSWSSSTSAGATQILAAMNEPCRVWPLIDYFDASGSRSTPERLHWVLRGAGQLGVASALFFVRRVLVLAR